MFTVPLFIFSKKTKSSEYLDSIHISANIPAGYTWDSPTATINGSSVPNPYYIDIRNGVEIITENGKKYIKARDYYLSEKFTTTANLDTTAVDASTGLEANYKRALWANSETDGVSGQAGRLECAYTIEVYSPKATSTNIQDINSLKIPVEIESKTKNVVVTGANYITPSLSNSIILGSNLSDTETIANGNSLTGKSNFINNSIFYPFAKNPSSTSNPTYGLDNNAVPLGAILSKITFSSSSAGIYGLPGRLLLKFNLYNPDNINQNTLLETPVEVVLLNNTNTLFTNINASVNLPSGIFYSQNIAFKNVSLKNENGSVLQDATAIVDALKLDITATYVNPNNELVSTQPEITSPIFLLKTDSQLNPPNGQEFEGFESLTLTSINSANGIDVYARFSNTRNGIESETFTYMGTATGNGTTNKTLYLFETDKSAKKAQVSSAKYLQVLLKGRLNTVLNRYEKSSLSRMFVATQPDTRRKSFTFNVFPNKLKFESGTTIESFDNDFLSPFLLKNSNKKTYSSGNYALYNLDGLKTGTIQLEHLQSKNVIYSAKDKFSTAKEEPFYTPSAEAVAQFNDTQLSEADIAKGKTKTLVLSYDIVTTQGGSGYYEKSSSTDTRDSRLIRFRAQQPTNQTEKVSVDNLFFPLTRKKISITAKQPGLTNNSYATQKYEELFEINTSGKYVDNCAYCSGGSPEQCVTETIPGGTTTGTVPNLRTAQCVRWEWDSTYRDCGQSDQSSDIICAGGPSSEIDGTCAGGGKLVTCSNGSGSNICCEDTSKCVEWAYPESTETSCTPAVPCTCTNKTYYVTNSHFNFKFENFREEIIEYTPELKKTGFPCGGTPQDNINYFNCQITDFCSAGLGARWSCEDKSKGLFPGKTKVLWSKPYDIERSVDSDKVIGTWIAEQKSSSLVTLVEPIAYSVEYDLPIIPERFTLPAIKFDKYAIENSNVSYNMKIYVLVEFLNSLGQVVGSSDVKVFTDSNLYETVIESPNGIGSAKKIKFYVGITPIDLTPYLNLKVSDEKFNIYKKLGIPEYFIQLDRIDQLNDVGVDFSGKPRLEYLDSSLTPEQRKLYQQSQAISLAYDLFAIAGITPYTITSSNYPVVKADVFYDGITSIPEGTSVTVEWQGKNNIGDSWGTWKATPLNYNTSGELALNKRYVRFRVTLNTEKTDILYKGYKSPVLDEIKIKFWPYNVPYVEKFALNLTDAGDKVVLSTLSAQNKNELKIKATTNGTWSNPAYETLTPLIPTEIADYNNNAKLKVEFLTDSAKLEETKVEIFGSDATDPITTTTTTSTTTTTTTTTTT